MANNKLLMVNLFDMVEQQLFFGDRLKSGEFGTLMNPGQFISSHLNQSNADDLYVQADLVNDVLDTSFIYKQLPGTVDSVYSELLEFAALPLRSTSDDEELELERIRQWQGEHEYAYTKYAGRYYDAAEAYEQYANTPNPGQAHLQRLKAKQDFASDQWYSAGFRQEWDDKESRLRQILSGNPTTWWGDLRRKLADQKKHSPHYNVDYYQTLLSPPVADWQSEGMSWASFSKVIREDSTSEHSHSTSWDGGFDVGWGLWSLGADASGSTSYHHSESDTSEVHVEFEYLRVRITRPWLTPNVFNYKFWTWKKLHGFQYVSDGGMLQATPPVRPLGLMPFLPTHIIVARNVKLSAKYTHRDETTITSQFSAGASFGWGPFSVSGHYSESNSDHFTHGSYDDGALVIAHPQIIAFSGILLPKTPDPNLDLPWGEDAVFPPHLANEHRIFMLKERARDQARLNAKAFERAELQQLQQEAAVKRAIISRQADQKFLETAEALWKAEEARRELKGVSNK